jgi:hypothetical protein
VKRVWIGLALLSASWLFGVSYYNDANWPVWAALIVCGSGMLVGIEVRKPQRREMLLAAILALPAVLVAPWPHRAGILLLAVGALACAARTPRRWPDKLGTAALAAGAVLVVQSLGMLAYTSVTARSHELPQPLAQLVYGIARWLGIDAALDGTTAALHSMRRVHYLGATWELLLDPATWCFLLGSLAVLGLRVRRSDEKKAVRLLGSPATLLLSVMVWLPVRGALLIGAFMHRALRTEYGAPLELMNQFWSPWVHLLLLSGPTLLAARFVRLPSGTSLDPIPDPGLKRLRRVATAALGIAAVFLIALGMTCVPSGRRKAGRILVDEHHSTWERTDRPYDTDWYGHESGYNYACIYDYCGHFYDMGRLTTPIDANALAECDVLMVKVPTSRYDPNEITEIERFVENGGGLLLVGEHTNVFNTGTHLNDIAERFGLRFRYDCLFDIDTVFTQLYRPPLVPHPIVQHMPPMDFAVSCSVAPGWMRGRAAMRATGLRSLPADYHASNFYPQVEDRADARYGAFVQLWTMGHGRGRVAAFTDSTIFSNFSTFEPGKAELMLGMLEWLNYREPAREIRPVVIGLGVILAVIALALTRKWTGAWLALSAAGLLGFSGAVLSVRAMHLAAMPVPQPVRPFTHVVVDRSVCDAPLSKSGFIAGRPEGFGIFERWILRLGWFTSRRSGADALAGDLLVFMHPNKPVTPEFRTALADYVAAGGKVLILDSPANAGSTANALLYPFGLRVDHSLQTQGALEAPQGWPATSVDSACAVTGGTPLIRIGQTPVAATANHGEGTVTVVGFGSRFTDAQMGATGDVIPDEQLRNVFELQFALFRSILPDSE